MNNFIQAMQKAGMKNVVAAADGATLLGYLHTGNLALNWIISGKFNGGWPLGHVVELSGDPSTGKSFLVSRAVSESQRFEKSVQLLDDTENAHNAIWSSTGLMVDNQRLAYPNPPSHTVEEHYNLVMAFIKAAKALKIADPSILALDSAALLSTALEVKQGFDKENMNRAKQIRKLLRLAALELADLPAVYMVTNHTIANVGDMVNTTTTPGGGGLKFQSTVRLALRTPAKMKDANKKYIGVKINCFVEKNRLAPPWRQCSMIIPFFQQISPVSGLVSLLIDLGELEVTKGHTLAYQGEDTKVPAQKSDFWKQDQSALELLAKHPNMLQELEAKKDLGIPKEGAAMVEEGGEEAEE